MSRAQPLVFIVEDDQDISLSLVDLLLDEGYRVECSRNGHEALAALRGGLNPDVIILDLMMPVMDGLSFLGILQTDPQLQHLLVVVLSASMKTAVPEGVPFFRKPINAEDLLAHLEAHHRTREQTTG